jgi:hypothetical protein
MAMEQKEGSTMADKAPTGAQIEASIDQGRAADKVDHPDPAAAPLATDAEAAGAPPARQALRMAARRIGPRPMAALSDDIKGLVAYVAIKVPLCIVILLVVGLSR